MGDMGFYVFTYTRSVCAIPDTEAEVWFCTRDEAAEELERRNTPDGPYKGSWRCVPLDFDDEIEERFST